MVDRRRSRSRARSSVHIKRERSSPSIERKDFNKRQPHSTRIKREHVEARPIYLDSRGRPVKNESNNHNGNAGDSADSPPPIEVEKPNFEPSGLLAAETNQRNGIALKYSVPPESRLPTISWRLYVFKPEDPSSKDMKVVKTIHLDKKEHYLFGCDQRVADVEIFHPTISKQHAVIQHRLVDKNKILPYVIDLESTNGTFLNDERIKPSCYYELRERDVIKFGLSTREYVLLNDKSA